MIISVKTTGLLGRYLPEGSARNRGDVEIADHSTVQDLLNTLAIPDNGRCYVAHNGTVLKTEELANAVIMADDDIVLMTAISAG